MHSLIDFIAANRSEIDTTIDTYLGNEEPGHYNDKQRAECIKSFTSLTLWATDAGYIITTDDEL